MIAFERRKDLSHSAFIMIGDEWASDVPRPRLDGRVHLMEISLMLVGQFIPSHEGSECRNDGQTSVEVECFMERSDE